MDIPTDLENNDAQEEDLNRIIMVTCQSYSKGIDTFLSPNSLLKYSNRKSKLNLSLVKMNEEEI